MIITLNRLALIVLGTKFLKPSLAPLVSTDVKAVETMCDDSQDNDKDGNIDVNDLDCPQPGKSSSALSAKSVNSLGSITAPVQSLKGDGTGSWQWYQTEGTISWQWYRRRRYVIPGSGTGPGGAACPGSGTDGGGIISWQ